MQRYLTYEELNGGIDTVNKLLEEDRYSLDPIMVQFKDKDVLLPRRRVIIYLLFWKILTDLKIDITSTEYIFPLKEAFNKGYIAKVLTYIYNKALLYPNITTEHIKDSIWDHINILSRFIRVELAEFVESLNMYDLCMMHEDEKLKELRNKDISINKGVQYIERYLIDAEKTLSKYFNSKTELNCYNTLYNAQRSKVLKAGQLRQLFCPIGLKTDVNDSVIPYVIKASTIQGTQNVFDFITESFIARKAAFYTHDAIQTAQYFGRRQHLITMTLATRHFGDCGTKALLDFKITQQNYKNMEGKFILEDGSYLMLNEFNVKKFIGKTVYMRSPLLCKFNDGTCEMCYGGLHYNVDPRVNTGMLSATCFVEKPSQKILSTKHYGTTDSIIYDFIDNPYADEFFEIVNNAVSFKDHWISCIDQLILGISTDSIHNLNDLNYITSDGVIYESKFSKISKLKVIIKDKQEYEINFEVNGVIPYLSKKFLLYLKSIQKELIIDNEYIYAPLHGLKHKTKFPILKSVILNYSMFNFVDRIIKFTDKTIAKYTNVSDALKDFETLVYSKIDDVINIVHLEMLLKSYLITSKNNYDIPILNNVENVTFSTMQDIISSRSIGGELAFERHKKYVSDPNTYLLVKNSNPLDYLIGII
jgi:hypothetical protein